MPLLAILAGTMAFVGRKNELLKWRIITGGMLVGCLVIWAVFGVSAFLDPVAKFFVR